MLEDELVDDCVQLLVLVELDVLVEELVTDKVLVAVSVEVPVDVADEVLVDVSVLDDVTDNVDVLLSELVFVATSFSSVLVATIHKDLIEPVLLTDDDGVLVDDAV